jgi:hypothetical protein
MHTWSLCRIGIVSFLLVLVVFSSGCSTILASILDINELKTGIFDLATGLAALMITIQGVQWILSTQPEEREECKKAILYILLALIVVSSANELVNALYCSGCPDCCT